MLSINHNIIYATETLQLRQYLLHNSAIIDLSVQLLFSQQLSSALVYLHSCKYVHRDIAARNVLLSSPRCVKLSDFGLSRCIEEDSIYKGKYCLFMQCGKKKFLPLHLLNQFHSLDLV